MANNVFLVSDNHFTHPNFYTKFVEADGSKSRPWDSYQEADAIMIERWNSVVKPTDKVYHLGDFSIGLKKEHIAIAERLNGRKVLIRGNHDISSLKNYLPHFYDIRATHKLDDMILSHVPIHTQSIGRFGTNVHGHLHLKKILLPDSTIDPRYFSVCVEQIDYTPIELGVLMTEIKKQHDVCGLIDRTGLLQVQVQV